MRKKTLSVRTRALFLPVCATTNKKYASSSTQQESPKYHSKIGRIKWKYNSVKKEPPKPEKPPLYEKPNYIIPSTYPHLRFVLPYHHTFSSYIPAGYDGKSLLTYLAGFKRHPQHYYENCLKNSDKIRINSTTVNTDEILKTSDKLEFDTHLHEPAVTSEIIKIVEVNQDFIVINKPTGMPVHPVSWYRYNTAIKILEFEYGYKNLHAVNRLDSPTSGIVILARSPKTASSLSTLISTPGQITKIYYARVKGYFPNSIQTVDAPLSYSSSTFREGVDFKNGKESKTVFEKMSYHPQSNSSVVKCIPLQGRKHQIRVHLSHIGFPIMNDKVYNKQIINDFSDTYDRRQMVTLFGKGSFDLDCYDCQNYRIMNISGFDIYLHAHTYEGPGWKYSADLPSWASADFPEFQYGVKPIPYVSASKKIYSRQS